MAKISKPSRMGGLAVDPNVAAFLKDAAPNVAAMTDKQRADMARVRVKYDLPPDLKESIETAAAEVGTSASQLAAWLLAWGMQAYQGDDPQLRDAIEAHKRRARALRFAWDLALPEAPAKQARRGR